MWGAFRDFAECQPVRSPPLESQTCSQPCLQPGLHGCRLSQCLDLALGKWSKELLNCSDLGDQAGDAQQLFETAHFSMNAAVLTDIKKSLSCGSFCNWAGCPWTACSDYWLLVKCGLPNWIVLSPHYHLFYLLLDLLITFLNKKVND